MMVNNSDVSKNPDELGASPHVAGGTHHVVSGAANDVQVGMQAPRLEELDPQVVGHFVEKYRSQVGPDLGNIQQYMQKIEQFYADEERGAYRKKHFPEQRIFENSDLDAKTRLERAAELLGLETLTPDQSKAILEAHRYCEEHGGLFMMDAGAKTHRGLILRRAGFDEEQIWLLGDSGLCGGIGRFLSLTEGLIANTLFFLFAATQGDKIDSELMMTAYAIYRAGRAYGSRLSIDEMTNTSTGVLKQLLSVQGLGMLVGIVGVGLSVLAKDARFPDISALDNLSNISGRQLSGMGLYEVYGFIKTMFGGIESTEGRVLNTGND